MGAIAHGNDFGGSIRYPAYACGVPGLRPTPDRIASLNGTATGDRPITAQLMAVQGPLARSVGDLRLGLQAMAQEDPRDGCWMPVPLEGPSLQRPLGVAIAPTPFGDEAPEVSAAVTAAGRWLADAGFSVEEVAPPHLGEAADLWHRLVINEESGRWPGHPQVRRRQEPLQPRLPYRLRAPALDGDQVLACFARRLAIIRAWQLFEQRFPVIILPVSAQLPFRNGQDQEGDAVVRAARRAAAAAGDPGARFSVGGGADRLVGDTRWRPGDRRTIPRGHLLCRGNHRSARPAPDADRSEVLTMRRRRRDIERVFA